MNLAAADEGRTVFGANVKAAYFDQLLSFSDLEMQVVEAIRPDHKEFNEPQRREILARFGLTGDIVFQKLKSLSGGERNRTALARLAALDANLLILDQPTKHHYLWARAALERALLAFEGTVIFVSHDRYFLNQVADHLLIVEPGRFREIAGNYDFYKHLVSAGLAAGEAASAREKAQREEKNAAMRSASADVDVKPAKRKRQFPYRKAPEIEAEIAQRESRIEQLHFELATPEVFRDPERIKAVNSEIDAHHHALPVLYEHWEEAVELNS
jgi:ATP-binding cassette subfamily F protein 3